MKFSLEKIATLVGIFASIIVILSFFGITQANQVILETKMLLPYCFISFLLLGILYYYFKQYINAKLQDDQIGSNVYASCSIIVVAHLLKVCDSDKLALWNFQLQNYLITKAACHGSRSTFTQQDLGVQNVEPKETRRGYFEKRSEVNWWFIGATCVTQPITCTVEPFSSKRI